MRLAAYSLPSLRPDGAMSTVSIREAVTASLVSMLRPANSSTFANQWTTSFDSGVGCHISNASNGCVASFARPDFGVSKERPSFPMANRVATCSPPAPSKPATLLAMGNEGGNIETDLVTPGQREGPGRPLVGRRSRAQSACPFAPGGAAALPIQSSRRVVGSRRRVGQQLLDGSMTEPRSLVSTVVERGFRRLGDPPDRRSGLHLIPSRCFHRGERMP